MKIDKSIIGSFVLLVVIASLYRIMPNRPLGFAPQIAMALFSGSVINEKKFAFLLPLFSMLLSDVMYEVLFQLKLTTIEGFYGWGQIINYSIYLSITVIGFAIKNNKISNVILGSVSGVLYYFLLSNFACWAGGTDINSVPYPKTLDGLLASYTAGLPFLKGTFYGTLMFSAMLFGGYYLIGRKANTQSSVA